MKLATLCMATVLAFSGSAFAQTSTPAPSDPAAPMTPSEPATPAPDPAAPTAPNTSPAQTTPNSGDLKPGANSFTEAQARSWLEDAGYTDVTGLVQAEDGIWRGHGRRNGTTVSVGVDYKGTISTD
ncbi:PepSY domain-containing protein [Pleomorphomonas sp. PLEO]|uniref:PepSY domain-containing protein n=1 Tax=Pleomorphomonas sp. PLEO TaxID=3239306 RepID=UPI00351F3B6E